MDSTYRLSLGSLLFELPLRAHHRIFILSFGGASCVGARRIDASARGLLGGEKTAAAAMRREYCDILEHWRRCHRCRTAALGAWSKWKR